MSRPDRVFGITSDLSGSIGTGIIANSFNQTDNVEYAEARDEKGKLLNIQAYSESSEATLNGLYVGTGVKAGTKVTIDGKDWLVTSSSKDQTNTDFQQSSVSIRSGDTETVIGEISGLL